MKWKACNKFAGDGVDFFDEEPEDFDSILVLVTATHSDSLLMWKQDTSSRLFLPTTITLISLPLS
jgi:hypothetical protein